MNIAGNEAIRAALLVYSDYSQNARGGLNIQTSGGVTTTLVAKISTIFARQLTVAASIGPSGAPATLTIRKFFMAGNLFVDESFPMPAAANSVFVSTSLLEEAEILITNNDPNPLNTAQAYATVISRQT